VTRALLPFLLPYRCGLRRAVLGICGLFRAPTILIAATEEEETKAACDWLIERTSEGIAPGEIGVFVRSFGQFARAQTVLEQVGIPYTVLDDRLATSSSTASLCTMELTRFRGYFPSYGERIHHGKAPYIPAGVPA